MSDYDELIMDELIEQSSLGTPIAKALRQFARDDDVEEVIRRLGYRPRHEVMDVTPAQEAVASQVEEFWRSRGYLPSISRFATDRRRVVHAVAIDDPDRGAICATSKKKNLQLATGINLLHPPCRRCLRSHIGRLTGVFPPIWW